VAPTPSRSCNDKDSEDVLAGCETTCAACQVASDLEMDLSVWMEESE